MTTSSLNRFACLLVFFLGMILAEQTRRIASAQESILPVDKPIGGQSQPEGSAEAEPAPSVEVEFKFPASMASGAVQDAIGALGSILPLDSVSISAIEGDANSGWVEISPDRELSEEATQAISDWSSRFSLSTVINNDRRVKTPPAEDLEIVYLSYVAADDALNMLKHLIGLNGVKVASHPRLNALLLRGNQYPVSVVRAVLATIDRGIGAASDTEAAGEFGEIESTPFQGYRVAVLRLRYANAQVASMTVMELFGQDDIRVTSAASNCLLVRAQESQLKQIVKLLKQWEEDGQNAEREQAVQEQVDEAIVLSLLADRQNEGGRFANEIDELEKSSQLLAQRAVMGDASKGDLRDAIERLFAMKQQQDEKELKKLEQRIARLQSTVLQRYRESDTIIDARVDTLLKEASREVADRSAKEAGLSEVLPVDSPIESMIPADDPTTVQLVSEQPIEIPTPLSNWLDRLGAELDIVSLKTGIKKYEDAKLSLQGGVHRISVVRRDRDGELPLEFEAAGFVGLLPIARSGKPATGFTVEALRIRDLKWYQQTELRAGRLTAVLEMVEPDEPPALRVSGSVQVTSPAFDLSCSSARITRDQIETSGTAQLTTKLDDGTDRVEFGEDLVIDLKSGTIVTE